MSLERARTMLAEARTLADYVKVHNVAEDIVASLRVRSNDAAEIQLLAAHAAGTALRQLRKSKGGRPKNSGNVAAVSEYKQALKDTGVPARTARYWQEVGEVPIERVQKYVAATKKAADGVVSIAGLWRELQPEYKKEARRIHRSMYGGLPKQEPRTPLPFTPTKTVSPDVLEEAAEVVAAGYKARAKIHHPDYGGNGDAMRLVNLAVTFLRSAIEEGNR